MSAAVFFWDDGLGFFVVQPIGFCGKAIAEPNQHCLILAAMVLRMVIDIQTVSIVIASAGVLAGVIYYILEIRHQSRLRQTESLIRLSPWFNMSAREVQEAITQVCSIKYKNYDDYLEKYSGKTEDTTLKILGNYFEGVGILVHRKLVGADIVYDFWGDLVSSMWDDFRSLIAEMRKDSGDVNMFRFWEYLSNEMKMRKQRLQPAQ